MDDGEYVRGRPVFSCATRHIRECETFYSPFFGVHQILLMRANMVGRIYIRPTLDPLVFVDVLLLEIYGILRIKNNLLKFLLCDTFLVKLAIALEEAAKQV